MLYWNNVCGPTDIGTEIKNGGIGQRTKWGLDNEKSGRIIFGQSDYNYDEKVNIQIGNGT